MRFSNCKKSLNTYRIDRFEIFIIFFFYFPVKFRIFTNVAKAIDSKKKKKKEKEKICAYTLLYKCKCIKSTKITKLDSNSPFCLSDCKFRQH